ncbi:hypothetical protein TNCV_52481 [Trichonephila clavipes]|nr:hypothetical protein TNCV_52481 [Trichonephila clavipes]
MERLTIAELADMHLIYGLAEWNVRAAERLYRERDSHRNAPDCRMFANLHQNLCEYGSLRGNRNSEDGPRIPTGNNIHILFHAWHKMCWIPLEGIRGTCWEFDSLVAHPHYAYYLVMIYIHSWTKKVAHQEGVVRMKRNFTYVMTTLIKVND